MLRVLIAIILLVWLPPTTPHSSGAPKSNCGSMTPSHNVQPQTGTSPYSIELEKTRVQGGEEIRIILTGPSFAGFFAMAVKRSGNGLYGETTGNYGAIKVLDAQQAQPIRCHGNKDSAVTHKSPVAKTRVEFGWEAPNDGGEYVILATFVRDYNTFWVRQPSATITVTKNEKLEQSPAAPAAAPPNSISPAAARVAAEHYAGCGETKGCFGIPSGCVTEQNCALFTTFEKRGDQYWFTVGGRLEDGKGYVASGLSFDDKMGQDSVIGCWQSTSEPRVNSYYNIIGAKGNQGSPDDPYKGLDPASFKTQAVDGWLFCSYRRLPKVEGQELGRIFDLEQDSYYLLLSRGDSADERGLTYHPTPSDRASTPNAVHLSWIGVMGAKSNILVELHAGIMIMAWLLCASSGMFTARYYKQTHTGINPMNKAFWFVVHLCCMFTTVFLTICGVVIIFIEIGGYSKDLRGAASWHPVLGLILTGLAVCQVLIAFFRPHPGTPRRPIFNWVHWTIGNSAHIVGIACIFLAETLGKSGVNGEKSYLWVLVGWVVFHVASHVVMSIHTVWADRQMEVLNRMRAVRPGPMKPSGKGDEAPGTSFRTGILIVYMLGAAGVAITLVVMVASKL